MRMFGFPRRHSHLPPFLLGNTVESDSFANRTLLPRAGSAFETVIRNPFPSASQSPSCSLKGLIGKRENYRRPRREGLYVQSGQAVPSTRLYLAVTVPSHEMAGLSLGRAVSPCTGLAKEVRQGRCKTEMCHFSI